MGKRSKSNTKQSSVSHESKRQRRGVVAYPEVPHESCPITSMFRLAFAAFLINTATATQEPSFLSIRGTHKWSLSLHLCMKAREFSALLIGCNFVDVIRTNSTVKVKLNTDNLDDFVDRYIQRGSLPSKSVCEVARRNKIYINALKDGAKGKVRDGPYSQMVLLRIGGYDESVTSVRPTLQINDCTEPPPFHTSIRTAQRKLTNAIRGDHCRDIYMGDDIDYVVEWLEMVDVLEGIDNKNKKMAPPPPPSKPNNSTANNNNDPTPIKPSSSAPPINNEITPGTNTKTKSLAPTNNTGGDKDPVATQLRMSDDNKLHISNAENPLPEDEEKKTDVDERIKALQMVQVGYENNIKTFKAAIKSAKDEWKAVRDELKLDKTSIFNKCEAILKTYRISRAAYHGGKFTGTDIIKMMNNAVEIFDEMKQVMLTEGRAKDGTDKDKEIITEFCTNTRDGLQLWNDIFARMSNLKADMNDEYCNETQKRIDAAMAFMRKLEFSITPKLHAVECHVVYQMRTVEGFPYMLEQWIEQYHQKGHKMDTQWHGQTWEHQSRLVSGKEYSLQRPESKKAAAKLGKYFGVKKRQRNEVVVAKENKIKEERKGGYDKILALLARVDEDVEMEDEEMEEVAEEEDTTTGTTNRSSGRGRVARVWHECEG